MKYLLGLFGGNAVDWTDINATGGDGETNTVTMPFATTLAASESPLSSSMGIFYIKNGCAPTTYSSPFSVNVGDTIAWGVQVKVNYSGVITITKTGGIFVDSFNANVTI